MFKMYITFQNLIILKNYFKILIFGVILHKGSKCEKNILPRNKVDHSDLANTINF